MSTIRTSPRVFRIRTLGLLAILSSIFFSGCASSPGVKADNPAVIAKLDAVPRDQKALLVIYRESNFVGGALRPTVMIDGKDLVNIGNGRVFIAALNPGKYAIEMDDKKSGAELDLKAGDSAFFKTEIVPGMWKGGGRLLKVLPEQGLFEAKKLNLVPVDEIEAPEYR
ncbi:DUF2846 domain-containing protein [Nibricoccus aquaticus]|nr:DUF2846 domain-containing protein [Nibricoccus aquaticus]